MAVNNYADRDDLLKKLTELDFMAVDLQLFLNTHTTDTEAIALYNKVIKAADIIRAKYEKEYGPLCSFRSVSRCDNAWQWVENPWPWESESNFDVKSEVCK